ncbi:DUF427 domain-containing protein [Anianabacter salinae]|uniref:DUF427 domain-containing protein n=1 Tax=Anianabacter salinae TaxID=2851023 RepID=UPI00225E201B|nr:DUF427 domain-containing protein [Anianabacter salinae]MBV0911618.1 DUF427 domain-containing protein [Anianabacter salinae]
MADHIKTRNAGGTWVVRAGGAVIAESRNAIELTEGDHPFVIYFPRDDVGMVFLDESDSRTTCPWKGEAKYFSIVTKSVTIPDAAWSYENPKDGVAAIAGHLAFYSSDRVAVEQL